MLHFISVGGLQDMKGERLNARTEALATCESAVYKCTVEADVKTSMHLSAKLLPYRKERSKTPEIYTRAS